MQEGSKFNFFHIISFIELLSYPDPNASEISWSQHQLATLVPKLLSYTDPNASEISWSQHQLATLVPKLLSYTDPNTVRYPGPNTS